MSPAFDLSINLTSLIALLGALITFVTSFNKLSTKIALNGSKLDAKFAILETRLVSVEDTLRDNRAIAARMAVIEFAQNTQAQAIASINVDIHDLRTGKGWIADPR